MAASADKATLDTDSDDGLPPYTEGTSIPTEISAVSEVEQRTKISWVRLTWVDLANNVRYRVLPWSYYTKVLSAKPRPGITISKVVFGFVCGTTADGFDASGMWQFVPDHNSLRMCPYEKETAMVFGWFEETNPSPGSPISAAPYCPRALLHRVVKYARERAEVEFLVGVETEFILLSSTSPITAVNSHSWCDSTKLPSGSKESTVLREIAEALVEAGIDLQMYHAEAAPGQYEVVTGPLPPLEAADALVFTRETIMNVASKHGLRATLSPRVFGNECGSAAHTHISMRRTTAWQEVENRTPPISEISPNLNTIEASFLAAVLQQLPALQGLTQPIPASYMRVVDGIWSGGTWVCWGTSNKDVPIRLVDAHNPDSRRFEFKCVDGLSNPYIVLAGILGVGARGIRRQTELKIMDLPNTSASKLDMKTRASMGIQTLMSGTLNDARARLARNGPLIDMLGADFLKAYLSVNKTVADTYKIGQNDFWHRKLIENY